MCGRYAQTQTEAVLLPRFDLEGVDAAPRPTWNAAPTQRLPVVIATGGMRRLVHARWGFAPPWAGRRPIINAQSESAGHKATFREALRRGRCVVPACSFYEWRGAGRGREPRRFAPRDDAGFAFAGLVDDFALDGRSSRCFTILTTPPNAVVAPVHDRMPVILDGRDAVAAWLAGTTDPVDLRPLDDDRLEEHAANPGLNRVDRDGPELWVAGDQTSLF